MLTIKTLVSALALSAAFAAPALALEYPIGVPQQKAGMEIAAVYLQPVEMEPEGHMRKASESDIHIEADIHALANNPNGFEEGAWIPYLVVKFEVSKIGADFKVAGRKKQQFHGAPTVGPAPPWLRQRPCRSCSGAPSRTTAHQ